MPVYGLTYLARVLGLLTCFISPARSLQFVYTNQPATPGAVPVPSPVPPASPKSLCPHVQTVHPSERSFSPECAPHESPGPRICVFHAPPPSHRNAPLRPVKSHFGRRAPAVAPLRSWHCPEPPLRPASTLALLHVPAFARHLLSEKLRPVSKYATPWKTTHRSAF